MTLYEYFKNMNDSAINKIRIGDNSAFWEERRDFSARVLSKLTVSEARLKLKDLTSFEIEKIIQAA